MVIRCRLGAVIQPLVPGRLSRFIRRPMLGQTSWRGFAQAIFERLGADPERVQPTTTEQFPRPAPRPAYSVLDGQGWRSAGLTPMPSWSDALHRAFAAVGDQFRSASS